MEARSSTIAWRIPWTAEPDRLQPWGRKSWTRLHWATSLSLFSGRRTLEKDMATHSSVLAWRIPGTEEPGKPPSMGSRRVRHDWSDAAAAAAAGKEMAPPPLLWPQKSQGQRRLVCYSPKAGHFWGEETVPGKLSCSPKAPELWIAHQSCGWGFPAAMPLDRGLFH